VLKFNIQTNHIAMNHKSGLSSRFQSIKCACRGIQQVIRLEMNARIHIFFALAAVALGILLNISRTEWLVIVVCIGGVISAESMNSAIEKLVDTVSPEYNENARLVKDMAAGAVLVAAMASLLVGLLIFIPRILDLF
jgi:diacylglycerol kinase